MLLLGTLLAGTVPQAPRATAVARARIVGAVRIEGSRSTTGDGAITATRSLRDPLTGSLLLVRDFQ